LNVKGLTTVCLPSKKPAKCSSQAWSALKSLFQGDHCPVPTDVNLGGTSVAVPAPAYLSISGWEACLGQLTNAQGKSEIIFF
jgi:hypothetical protein